LPEFGWKPYALCISEDHVTAPDQERMKDVSAVTIVRTPVLPTLPELALRLKNWALGPRKPDPCLEDKLKHLVRDTSSPPHPTLRRVLATLRRYFLSLFELPDQQIGWLLPAVCTGYRLIRREAIEAILATSPPITSALVGLILSKLTSARLITDLRDPLILHDRKTKEVRSRLSDAIERRLETRLLSSSHRIISTTEHYAEFLRSQYPHLPPDRIHTIPNGFDSADFPPPPKAQPADPRFVLSYLGTFYFGRTPEHFLCALSELFKDNCIPRDEVRVHFVGHVRQAEGVPVQELLSRTDLNGCVRITDAVPYSQSIRFMQESQVLLLFAPAQYFSIPGKAYEYFGSRKPILCFGDSGATADLIRKVGGGIVVNAFSIPEIKDAITHLYSLWRSNRPLPYRLNPIVFERRALTRRLADLLSTRPA
jgi:glycosyltransferase involved in cell wall biosynthesis